MTAMTRPLFASEITDAGTTLSLSGDWIVASLHEVEATLRTQTINPPVRLDVSALGKIDTAGVFLLQSLFADAQLIGSHAVATDLFQQVRALGETAPPPIAAPLPGFIALLDRTGRGVINFAREARGTLSFLGEAVTALVALLVQPQKLRWNAIVSVMETAGVNAMPIIAFLSFFVGIVVAYIGATTLKSFDLDIFTVELVGYSMLREFGVVLTGIVLAGRTNSSVTAQIGAMRMRQEIDAMQTLGLKPMDVLVVPRLIAMTVMAPVLSFVATLAGIAGGVLVAWLSLDINPAVFIERLRSTVPLDQFWIGLSKAPVFGFVTALIACRQGLLTGGSVQSLGERVTTSVVQAIFAIIALDALFAILYMELGL